MKKLLVAGSLTLFNVLITNSIANSNSELSNKSLVQSEYEKYVEHSYERDYALSQTLGDIHFFKDDYNSAEKDYLKALEIAKKLGDKESEALVYMRIARLYRNKGDKEKAREYYEKAYEIYKDIGDQKGAELASKLIEELGN